MSQHFGTIGHVGIGSGRLSLATGLTILSSAASRRASVARVALSPAQVAKQAVISERDAWNKEVDARKAAKRAAKGRS